MSNQVIPSYSTDRDSYPSLYKGDHKDYYFSLLPYSVPFPLFAIPNRNPRWNSILSFKALYTLWGVYKVINLPI